METVLSIQCLCKPKPAQKRNALNLKKKKKSVVSDWKKGVTLNIDTVFLFQGKNKI